MSNEWDACVRCGATNTAWAGWSKRVTRWVAPEYLTYGKRDVKTCADCGYTWRYGRNGPVTDRTFTKAAT